MHGLIFEILEDWVTEAYGTETWHSIKEAAGSSRKDKSYLRSACYEDQEFVDIVLGASKVLNVQSEDVIEAYGRYFLNKKLFSSGYSELLRCQGSTLRQWLSNLNAMHEFIARSFPGDKFIAPVFWCEDCDECDGSILLHYYSMRGSFLAPLVVGLVEELALRHFHLEVKMHRTALQDEDGATFTTWRISAVDESQHWKLSPSVASSNEVEQEVNFDGVSLPSKCPFSGRQFGGTPADKDQTLASTKCPFHQTHPSSSSSSKLPTKEPEFTSRSQSTDDTVSTESLSLSKSIEDGNPFQFTLQHMNGLFPFHILVDESFTIVNVGEKLPELLNISAQDIQGLHIGDIVQITRPVMVSSWDWKSLNKLSDQNFFLTPISELCSLQEKVSMEDSIIRFKASMFRLSSHQVLFTLTPDAKNVTDLRAMGLTLSDLPLSGCQRDALFLGEHIAKEVSRAHELDKLTKKLTERDLSKVLLNSMLPEKVAEALIKGKTVEPVLHENVTLFFSDVVGFTTICDKVEPWDVIDMMNQLFSVMDYLASHFDLYKVETVGDGYMCCSGLPEPDELHAEKVANFALAVLECVKHVKSPIDGSPIQLRIGIHTGSCTSGVVGTLTPHFALFGDMVNTTSRHESTGMAGKIQCSSELYNRLVYSSPMECSQFNFKARGLVDMKGKGEHYTYWLESATGQNFAIKEEALQSLSRSVEEMLASNSWKKRSYFDRDGSEATVSSRRTLQAEQADDQIPAWKSADGEGSSMNYVLEVEPTVTAVVDSPPEKVQSNDQWMSLGEGTIGMSQEEVGKAIFDILSSSLESCIRKKGRRLDLVLDQLQEYVATITEEHGKKSHEQTLQDILNLLLRTNFLWEARAIDNNISSSALGASPWDHFVLLFSAFVHQVKHTGSTNAALESERHVISQMYEGLSSCQQRRSVDFAFTVMEDDFGDLYDEITFGCPNFRSQVRKVVLSTDLESEASAHSMLQECDRLNSSSNTDEREARQRNVANIGLILAVAAVARYTQSQGHFLQESRVHYKASNSEGCYERNWEHWYYCETIFLRDTLMPLIEEVLRVLPRATYLKEGATKNIAFWDEEGENWLSGCELKEACLPDEDRVMNSYRVDQLVATNVGILETLLIQVMNKSLSDSDAAANQELSPQVLSELREFVTTIASGYEYHKFHNFLHASHVTHLATLFVKVADKSKEAISDIVHDPVAQFAVVLAALVHDFGHMGVPNSQLAGEHPELAEKYQNKSIAERNSIDSAWRIFMSKKFKNLQHCIFQSVEEREHFHQLLVSCVMATDIFDPEQKAQRKSRWEKAFASDESLVSEEEAGQHKSRIVIEHIMQASDVAHTMQNWEIYRQWNECLFREMYDAYQDGRDSKDPSVGWYEGELWFFDNWVIPLARNLKQCGVMDIVSDQLLEQAHSNRKRWQLEGKEICEEMFAGIKASQLLGRTSWRSSLSQSMTSESCSSFLASQMVTEAESLSKVMSRYERKYETVLGNLIALAYKGKECPMDLERQELADVHMHFKRQEWYRSHIHDGNDMGTHRK